MSSVRGWHECYKGVLGMAYENSSVFAYCGRCCKRFAERLRASARRSRLWRVFAGFGLGAILAILLMPSVALARESYGVIWGPQTIEANSGRKGVVVVAGNAFSAAAYALGRNPNDRNTFTDTVKTKLSNASTGGNFYSFVQHFQCVGQDGENYPDWAWSGNMGGAFYTWAYAYGGSQVWWADYTADDRADALEDLGTVLRGGDLGGGSGGDVTGDYVTYTIPLMFSPLAEGGQGYGSYYLSFGNSTMRYTTNLTNYTKNAETQSLLSPALTVRVARRALLGLSDSDLQNTCLMLRLHTSNDGIVYCNLFHASGGFSALSSTSFTSKTVTNNGVTAGPFSGSFYRRGDVGFDGTLRRRFIQFTNTSGSLRTYSYRNGVLYLELDDSYEVDGWSKKDDTSDAGYAFAGFFGSGGTVLPPNNWPEDSGGDVVTPEPDPPESDPVGGNPPQWDPYEYTSPTDDPEPVTSPTDDPVPTPTPYTYTQEPTGTDATDYTPWLRAILAAVNSGNSAIVGALNTIDASLNTHCKHLQAAMSKWIKWLWSNLKKSLASLTTEIETAMLAANADMQSYLDTAFAYLGAQLKYVKYDDSELRLLLLRIWSALEGWTGGGLSVDFGDVTGALADIEVVIDGLVDELALRLDSLFDDLVVDLSTEMAANDYTSVLASIDENVTGILHTLEGLDIPDYSTALSTLTSDVEGVIDAIDALDLGPIDLTDVLDALDDILAKMDDLVPVYYGDVLSAIASDVADWYGDWVEFTSAVSDELGVIEGQLDDIISRLGRPTGDPWPRKPIDDPTGGPIIGPIEIDPVTGMPTMPNWEYWAPTINIPALQAAVAELLTKFPFCTLADLTTLFVYINAPAVAPQFDLPMPNPSNWGQPYLMHIDLSQFDAAAGVLRMGIVLLLTVKLMQRTIRIWTKDDGVGEGVEV